MPTLDDDGDGRRLALVIATSTYSDPTLQKLRAPGRDAAGFADVLRDRNLGGFEVLPLVDQTSDRVQRKIAEFCAEGGPSDLALIYFSCHGVMDDRSRLYYATTNTERQWLSVTAISAQWLNDQLEDCRCRRQLLILDCCHSGAFAKGAKGDAALALQDRFEARGRVVLTASRATEYSFEGDRVLGEGATSWFTGALIEGIRSGQADGDKDGRITVTELYDYSYAHVKKREARQTPGLWMDAAEGQLLVAQSPLGAIIEPAPLPEHLQLAIESPSRNVRQAAVEDIARLLGGPNAGLAVTARATLEHIAEEDAPRVAAAARGGLEQARREAEEQARREAEEQARREAEEQARREAEEQARREAEEQARREAEEQARREAEEQARREAEEQARREAEEQARREAEEQARREAEEQARREAEEQARREAEEQARRKADEQARGEAEEQAIGSFATGSGDRSTEKQARRKAEKQARRKAEEQARRKAEERARRKAQEEASHEAQEEASHEAQEEASHEAQEEVIGSFATGASGRSNSPQAASTTAPQRGRFSKLDRGALIAFVTLTLIVTVLALVASSSDNGGGPEYIDGPTVRLRSLGTGSGSAYLYRPADRAEACCMWLEVDLDEGTYEALLFDDLNTMRNFERRPSDAVQMRGYGALGTLDFTGTYQADIVDVPPAFRSYNYFGVAELEERQAGKVPGRLILYQRVDRLRDPP